MFPSVRERTRMGSQEQRGNSMARGQRFSRKGGYQLSEEFSKTKDKQVSLEIGHFRATGGWMPDCLRLTNAR